MGSILTAEPTTSLLLTFAAFPDLRRKLLQVEASLRSDAAGWLLSEKSTRNLHHMVSLAERLQAWKLPSHMITLLT